MWSEVFTQGPAVYIPVMIFSLIFTLIGYGAFPLIFAITREDYITKKKYRNRCFLVNIIALVIFMIIGGGASNGAPYCLWTMVFSHFGAKILEKNGRLKEYDNNQDGGYMPENPNRVVECKNCGYRDKVFFTACPKCGKGAKRYVYLNEEKQVDLAPIRFCRKCGEELIANSSFCSKCGTEVIKENQQ